MDRLRKYIKNKIQDLITVDGNFSDIDLPLRQQYNKMFVYIIVVFIAGIVLAFSLKSFYFFFLFLMIAAFLGIYLFTQIFKCIKGKVGIYSGTVKEITYPNKIKRFLINGATAQVVLMTDDGYYLMVRLPANSKIREGNKLKIYAEFSAVYPVNDNTYQVNKHLYYYRSSY